MAESAFEWVNSTGTDAAGNYDFGGLPTGTYQVEFRDDFVYITEYYDNAPDLESATDISVTAGSTTSSVDAVLVEWGHITGTVTDGSIPLQGIQVDVYLWTGSNYESSDFTITDASGNYDIGQLATGMYRLEFSDLFDRVYLTEYYDDAPDLESATDISVTVGSTTSGIDAVMVKGGHITGTVSDGTNPLPGIEVMVYRWTGSNYEFLHSTGTDASGNYDMGHLPTGIYRVQFQDQWNGVYASEWYDDAPDLDSATDISVTAASTTSGIDAVLTHWGHISGTVSDGINPLPDIKVTAYRWTGGYDWSGSTNTDASGHYDLDHLATGSYRVEFYDITGVYGHEYFDDAADLDNASDISVAAGSTTAGIDAVLNKWDQYSICLPSILAK
jgi:5-hydroxyisourate hydrolase-like protein (transthyretin family)